MQEVFEKIIENLEERSKEYNSGVRLHGKPEEMLTCDAIEIVKQAAEEYNNGWISVKDRLPEKTGSYLVIGKTGGAVITRWYEPSEYHPNGHFGGNCSDYIRYWMPRPEPYQTKGE